MASKAQSFLQLDCSAAGTELSTLESLLSSFEEKQSYSAKSDHWKYFWNVMCPWLVIPQAKYL